MNAPGDRRRRTVSREELDLWRHAVRDTDPLPGRAVPQEPAPPAEEAPIVAPRPSASITRTAVPRPQPPRELPPLSLGASQGTDKRTAERLRRGEMQIDGRIDLHGMTQDQAHGALTRFILGAHDNGSRCVLVITGKGFRDGQAGILRQATPRWLNAPPLRQHILSFAHAQPRHGGEGALYVLLKRRRT